jgi:photosystem II stability/assembly factor-like uncharacterized protein
MIGQWRSLGPTLITEDLGATGRVTSIVIDETDPSTIYTGSLSGNPSHVGGAGIWKTTDRGGSWRPIGDDLPGLQIAAIALRPAAASPLYAAVMGRDLSSDGLFVTDDDGAQWDKLSDDTRLTGRLLLIDPTTPTRIFMAGTQAVLRSDDGGATWSDVLAPPGAAISDLALHPTIPTRLYAGVSHATNDAVAGLYESLDSGETWTKLLGCPGAALPSRMAGHVIRVAVAPNRSYVTFKSPDEFLLYRTTDVGCSIGGRLESGWERGWAAGSDVAKTIWSYIYVHPADPDIVYATGTSLRRSTNGGKSFSVVGESVLVSFAGRLHHDHHALAVDPSDDDVVYTGCDGGLYRSTDRGGYHWSFVGEGMRNTEFYDLAHAATDPGVVIGGTQDNGTLQLRDGETVWSWIRKGDGGTVDIDPTDAGILYAMLQYADSIARKVGSDDWEGLANGLPMGSECFNLHFQVHPANRNVLLASCRSLWRTATNEPPGDWQAIFPPPGLKIEGVVVRSAVDPRTNAYFAATSAGELWAGVNGANWERVFNASDYGAAGKSIVDVDVDIDAAGVLYLSTNSTGSCRIVRLQRTGAPGLAMTAQDVTFDLPADVIVSAVAVDRLRPGAILVGTTDRGVYRGRPGAAGTWHWERYSEGLPFAVSITRLLVHPVTGIVRAGTCGRGAYEIDTDDPVGSVLAVEGRVSFLRLHDSGGFGPPHDRLEGEAVVSLDTTPGRAFGFAMRPEAGEPPHAGMLDLLRSALIGDRRVRLEYVRTGPRNGRLFRAQIVG